MPGSKGFKGSTSGPHRCQRPTRMPSPAVGNKGLSPKTAFINATDGIYGNGGRSYLFGRSREMGEGSVSLELGCANRRSRSSSGHHLLLLVSPSPLCKSCSCSFYLVIHQRLQLRAHEPIEAHQSYLCLAPTMPSDLIRVTLQHH